MPLQDLHIGPFQAVYVGLASGASSDVLVQLTSLTTTAHRVQLQQPEVHNYTAANSLQSGPVTISAALTFLSDDDDIWKLAMGNYIDADYPDSPSEYVKLMLLLIHGDEDANSSFLIPTIKVAKGQLPTNWDKNNPTSVPLNFEWQQLNRWIPQLYYKRSVSELHTILGTRSPF